MDVQAPKSTPSKPKARNPGVATSTPSKSSSSSTPSRANTPSKTASGTPGPSDTNAAGDDSDEEGDDERPDVNAIKAFAAQVQRAPSGSNSNDRFKKVVIPKRGEKDFEPLDETVNIQEKMLRESRQAFFDGMGGVRGMSNKNISHAVLKNNHPFVQVKISRGNLFLTAGHTIRSPAPSSLSPSTSVLDKGKAKASHVSTMELLPEEALYLLERGSMQIWHQSPQEGRGGADGEQEEEGDMEWDEEVHGFKGAWEMSAQEAFSHFIGQEGLTLERYQVYASLKRLGYVVQRIEPFLPLRFRRPPGVASTGDSNDSTLMIPKRTLTSIHVFGIFRSVWGSILTSLGGLMKRFLIAIGLGARRIMSQVDPNEKTLLAGWSGMTYSSLYERLRIIPSRRGLFSASGPPPEEAERTPICSSIPFKEVDEAPVDIYEPLAKNPYLPFFHVWKPNSNWSRVKWDKGSEEGLRTQVPNFWVGIVDARSEKFPAFEQMHDIFPMLPHQEAPRLRVRKPTTPASAPASVTKTTTMAEPLKNLVQRVSSIFRSEGVSPPAVPGINTFADLKQGDRNLVVAVVDGGNTGWMRFGRGTFENHSMVPWNL